MAAIDTLTGVPIVIDYDHSKVHKGKMYNVSQYYTAAAGATINMMIVAGADELHAKLAVQSTGQCLVKFYGGITSSANGTTCTVINMNRNSTNTTTAIAFYNATWSTNTENLLDTVLIAGGNIPAARIGGEARQNTEWELKANTKYLVSLVNQAGATITATINAQFYED